MTIDDQPTPAGGATDPMEPAQSAPPHEPYPDPFPANHWAAYAAVAFVPDPQAEVARLRAEDAENVAAANAELRRLRDEGPR